MQQLSCCDYHFSSWWIVPLPARPQTRAGLQPPLTADLTTQLSPPSDQPFISVQADWELSVREVQDGATSSSFWVSSTNSQHQTVEGKCSLLPASASASSPLPSLSLSPSPDFAASLLSPLTLSATCSYTTASYIIQAPSQTISRSALGHAAPASLTAVAFSPTDADQLLTGGSDGCLTLCSLAALSSSSPSPPLVSFAGHAGDVDTAVFFPSGAVVLSAALDLSFRIWAVQGGGHCAAVLTGHKQRITGVQMIDRGRQFVSSSLDGSCLLWDCGRGGHIAQYGIGSATGRTTAAAVNHCLVMQPQQHPLTLSSSPSSAETEAYAGWLLLTACQDGAVRGYDMRAPAASAAALTVTTAAPVTRLAASAASSPFSFSLALSSGVISTIDLRTVQPVRSFRRERDVSVTALEAEKTGEAMWSADELGVVTRWRLGKAEGETGAQVERELSGADMDSIRGLSLQRADTPAATAGGVRRVATAAADAVRLYDMT